MKPEIENLEEYAQEVLTPLRTVPPLSPEKAGEEKGKFMRLAEQYRLEKSTLPGNPRTGWVSRYFSNLVNNKVWVKALAGAILAIVVLVASSASVFASQNSLPGEPLYLIKSLSEDLHLLVVSSPQSKLDLTLDYTDRRMGEISSLISNGKNLPNQASERFNQELENALILASQLEDPQMQAALGRIKRMAKSQGMTIEELISLLPEQAGPAVIKLQQRLLEQVQLSTIGEEDPQAFRNEVRERHLQIHKPSKTKTAPANSGDLSITPENPGEKNPHGKPSDVPGHDGSAPGQGDNNQGNGNQHPDKTQEP